GDHVGLSVQHVAAESGFHVRGLLAADPCIENLDLSGASIKRVQVAVEKVDVAVRRTTALRDAVAETDDSMGTPQGFWSRGRRGRGHDESRNDRGDAYPHVGSSRSDR